MPHLSLTTHIIAFAYYRLWGQKAMFQWSVVYSSPQIGSRQVARWAVKQFKWPGTNTKLDLDSAYVISYRHCCIKSSVLPGLVQSSFAPWRGAVVFLCEMEVNEDNIERIQHAVESYDNLQAGTPVNQLVVRQPLLELLYPRTVQSLSSHFPQGAVSRFVPIQWETALLCNDASHWLGAGLESSIPHLMVGYL